MIDAVVVTAAASEPLFACLEHLRSPLLSRVVVVDNGSPEGVAVGIGARRPDVDVVRLDPGRGLSAAFNRGAERGGAELILFLNDDIVLRDRAAERLAEALRSRPQAVAAGARLVEPGTGATQLEYQPRRFPTLATFVGALAGLERFWGTNPWTGGHRRRPLGETGIVPVDHAPGACLLVSRKAFEHVGGWDEGFEFWYEDVDLSRRLHARGEVLYVPDAVVEHVGGFSAKRLSSAQVVARSYRGALRYGQKHFPRRSQVGLGLVFAAVGWTRALLAARDDGELAAAYRSVARQAVALAAGRPLPR